MNQFSPIPLAEGGEDQSHLPPFTLASDTPSCSCSILFNTSQEQGANDRDNHLLQQEPEDHLLISKSSDHLVSFPTNYNNNDNNNSNYTVEQASHGRCVNQEDLHGPGKWMPSKMRFMRKMMNSGHDIMSKTRRNMQILQDRGQDSSTSMRNNSSNSPSGIIRVCSDCNTTKTPLWRSGPRGPKSLCNACGIRQRKARQAMAAAAAGGVLIPSEAPGKMRKEKKSDVDRTIPFKKRCKNAIATTTQKKCFDDVMISLSKSSAVHRVFPQDERDAALLLMDLSWGRICS
ncbi:protein CYTOKININ-RESPONSIVE GATA TRANSCRIPTION FACTOR 1-like isoform X1 [Phoenix dactylifera]|uniref:Protein CYTOKININ-RESPONSIVE GATA TRANSCRIPTION FACTOR 1-like isoform X1 n=1 Tax=Phoenix dactylifera TaxID=42345 RepID=A0A8B7C789_PHODC|nr:protein CYTOKININ-RESPONSIVE GATA TRANSCRIPTION FACTOR 1-like isoform X1 [Phoenix dactylifera]